MDTLSMWNDLSYLDVYNQYRKKSKTNRRLFTYIWNDLSYLGILYYGKCWIDSKFK